MTVCNLKDLEDQWPSCRTREARRLLWEQVVAPSRFWFAACHDLVQQRDAHTLALWLQQDDPIKRAILNFDTNRCDVVRAHLLCAHLALHYDSSLQPEELDDLLRPIAEDTGCARGFLRDLTWAFLSPRPSLQPVGTEELYVLLVEEGRDQGVVGLLSLHLMPNGTGALYPHHELALVLRDAPFRQAEHHAQTYVQALGLWPQDLDVRWQVTRPFDNRPVRRLAGASMGAAWALSLAKLCATASVDDTVRAATLKALDLHQVAISATFDLSGRLGKVAQTGPKILAAFDAVPREFLRLIVVSSDCEIPLAWQTHPFASPQVVLADTCDDVVDRLHEVASEASRSKRLLGSARQRWAKAVALGLLTAVVGLAASALPLGFALEERFGLTALFHLRGVRQPPPEVVVVNVDRPVAERLGLPLDPEKWPRSVHAQLTQHLVQAGAAAIAFDILFEKTRVPTEDHAFAQAIRQARNVVLFAYLRRDRVDLSGPNDAGLGTLHIEHLVPPMPLLAQSATALAPLPLPRVPVSVTQYWTFKTGAGGKPTLPVVMFQLFALDVYDTFYRLVREVHPSQAAKLPRDGETLLATMGLESFIGLLRHLFTTGQLDGKHLLERLRQTPPNAAAAREQTLLRSWINLYRGGDSQYIDFYGPSGTIPLVPYDRVLHRGRAAGASQQPLDLRGKAVFVGFSEHAWPERQDAFYTVFSQADGSDISGVEMAATAFANLVEDRPIRWCSGPVWLLVLVLWGSLLGTAYRLLPTGLATLSALGFGALYVLAAQAQFAASGTWYPLVIPVGVQLPLAFVGAILWRYIDTDQERQKIRRALRYYLPTMSVERAAPDMPRIRRRHRALLWRPAFRRRFGGGHVPPEDIS
jgi:CHASE2 domain-containing sensor protein